VSTSDNETISEKKALNRIQWFFIVFCAAAEKDIMEECPTEWQKYTSLGATVLFTGLLAWVSCGYALYSVFQNVVAAFLFGFLWGVIIFNLDRFIISTLKKLDERPYEKYGPFKGIFRIIVEFFCASPRIILALIIAITIAKPLEVKIFEDRLRDAIVQNKHNAIDKHKEQIEKRYKISADAEKNEDAENEVIEVWSNKIREIEAKVNRIDTELKSAEDPPVVKNHLRGKLKEVEIELSKNRSKKASTDIALQQFENSVINEDTDLYAFNAQKKKLMDESQKLQYAVNVSQKEADKIKKEIDETKYEYYKTKYEELETTKQELKNAKAEEISAQNVAKAEIEAMMKETGRSFSNNFVTQLEALGALKENDTMRAISMMIMLLFFAMELTPIFAKLISRRGPYDERVERIEYEYKIKQRRTSEIETLEVEAMRMQAEDKISAEQRIYKKKLDEWEDIELKTIKEKSKIKKEKISSSSPTSSSSSKIA